MLVARIDPELRSQLEDTGTAARSLAAVVTLREADRRGASNDVERTDAVTTELLRRVEAAVGHGAEDVNVFRNLRSFVVVASRDFLAELLDQPEVEAATTNRAVEPL